MLQCNHCESNMQTFKLCSVFNFGVVRHKFYRNIAVNSASVKINNEVPALKSWKEIPGPSSLPILGPLLHFIPGGMLYKLDGLNLLNQLHKSYGPIVRMESFGGGSPLIMLFDAESSAQILRGENWMPIRPGFPSLEYYRKKHKNSNKKSDFATGLLTDEGDIWKKFRSAVNQVLLQPKTIKLYTSTLDEVAQDMIKRMKYFRNEKNMINSDFSLEMNLWALESIGLVALGCRLYCLQADLAEDSPARKLIQSVNEIFVVSNKLDFKSNFWRYFPTPTFKKAMKIYKDLEDVSKYFVKKGVQQFKKNTSKSDNSKGVLEKLIEMNEEYAHAMALDMLFAGVDTAATTMTATLYLLANNPEKQEKLREEILSKSERRPYLKACIKESMRLMPVVPGNIRLTSKEYDILGYRIPKDIQIAFSHQLMSVMEQYYPRSKEFIPERWLAEKNDPLYHGNAHPFANAPFGFGVRSCIGRRIADLEIEIFLARIMENFKVEWFGPAPRVVLTSLNYIKGPCNFIFKDI